MGVPIFTHLVHIQFPTLLHREGQFVVFKELCHCCLGILHTNHFMASLCQPKHIRVMKGFSPLQLRSRHYLVSMLVITGSSSYVMTIHLH